MTITTPTGNIQRRHRTFVQPHDQKWVSCVFASLYRDECRYKTVNYIIEEGLSTHHATYYKLDSYFLRMAELALVDYFVMGEAIGIVATLFVSFYFSRKQMQKLSVDIETKVLSDLDEKMSDLTHIAVEKPQLIRIVSNVESDLTEEIAYTYHLLNTFAHAYHMYQRGVVSDNEWTGWLRRMRTCFEQGKIREYWEGGLELEKWFDPAFEDFIDNEIVKKTSPKHEM